MMKIPKCNHCNQMAVGYYRSRLPMAGDSEPFPVLDEIIWLCPESKDPVDPEWVWVNES